MKRTILVTVAAGLVALGCRGGGGEPVDLPSDVDRPGEGQAAMITKGGIITAEQGDRLQVSTLQGETVDVRVDEETQIMFDEHPAGREVLERGASVRVSYRERQGENFAARIDVDAPSETEVSPSIVPGDQGFEQESQQGKPPVE